MPTNATDGISSAITIAKEKGQMKYLDPKVDLIFKKIFSKHPDLLFTDAELRAYDKALDNIRVERTLLNDRYKKGIEKGIQKGIGQGILQGIEKVAKAMLLNRVPDNQIIAYTGLTQEQLNSLKD